MSTQTTAESGDTARTTSKPVWRRRAYRAAVAVFISIALYAALGFVVAPRIAKWQGESQLAKLLNRDVTIQAVSFNPFTLQAAVQGLLIRDRENPKPLFGFDALTADLAIRSITKRGLVFTSVKLVKPRASLIRLDANRYNFSDIVDGLNAPRDKTPVTDASFRFAIGNIELVDGRLEFDDRPEQTLHDVTAINFAIPAISNFPADIATKVEPRFNAMVNGDPFVVTGESRPFHDSLETALRVSFSDLDLTKYLEYVPAELDFNVGSAKLAAELLIRYAKPPAGPMAFEIEGDATITQLSITDKTGPSLLELDALKIGLKRIDLAVNKAVLSSVQFTAPRVAIRRDAAARLNLEHLVPRTAPDVATSIGSKQATGAPSAVRAFQLEIASIVITDGQVLFTDESNGRAFKSQIDGLALEVEGFSLAADRPATYSIAMRTDLGVIAKSSGSFTTNPLTAAGRIELGKVRVADYAPYFEQALAVDFPKGTISAGGGYRLESNEDGTRFTLIGVDGTIESLLVTRRVDGDEMLRIGKLDVTGIDLDVANRSLAIGSLAGMNAKAVVRRHANGSLNFANLTAHDPATIKDRPVSDDAMPPWRYAIKKGVLDRSSIRFIDESTSPPVEIALDAIQLNLGGLSSTTGAEGSLQLRSQVNESGAFATIGKITLSPFSIELDVDLTNIDANPFEPYFSPFLNLSVESGNVSTQGKASFAIPEAGPVRAHFDGDITIGDLATTDKLTGEDLLRWRSLVLGQVGFTVAPMVISVGEIALADFYSRVTITTEGRLNLQGLLARSAATTSTPSVAAAKGAAPEISIGRITMQSGNIYFSDQFVKPSYSTNFTNITGAIGAVTSEKAGIVDLQGKIDNTGAVGITGKVNPLAQTLYLDIKGEARDIDLPTMTPYSAKYIGYQIDKGKLSFKVAYRVEDGQLTASNSLILDQLTFGEKIDSPDALAVPIQLAVALLKDRHGVIDINLPVSGSLNDPAFNLGGVIVRLLSNLIVNAVRSPFSLLAAAFGSSGEELSYVEYDAGFAMFSPAAEGKLKTLAKALTDRPALQLEIRGRIDPTLDRDGLRRAKLVDRMLALKLKDPAGKSSSPPHAKSILLDPNEYSRRVTEIYRAADFQRPRNVIGVLRELPVPEMEKLILTNTTVTDDDLRDLARRRAQYAKDYLVDAGGIAAARIFIVSPRMHADEIKINGKTTRAEFALK